MTKFIYTMIKLEKINKKYESKLGDQLDALKNIELEFGATGMCFIIGKSGSGKTTLLNLIGGFSEFDQGEIYLDGSKYSKMKKENFDMLRNHIFGYLFQEHNLLDYFTVYENVALPLSIQGLEVDNQLIKDTLKKLDIYELINRYPSELSTGQKQRVALARTIIKKPKVILADEPTGSLDQKTGEIIIRLLDELAEECLVIVVSHDNEFAQKYGDRIIKIQDGLIEDDVIVNYKRLSINGNYNEDNFKVSRKGHLAFKDLLKITYKNIITKPFRLLITIILTSIAFTLLGFSLVSYTHSEYSSYLESLDNINRYYVPISKKMLIEDSGGNIFSYDSNFNSMNVSNTYNIYNNNNVLFIYNDFNTSFEPYFTSNEFIDSLYYSKGGIVGSIEISDELLKLFGFEVVVGKLPEKSSDHYEVAIPLYLFEYLKEFGFSQFDDTLNEPENIINRTIVINDNPMLITGVIDTKFQFGRYETLKQINPETDLTDKENYLFNEYNIVADYGPHALLFFYDGFYNDELYTKNENQLLYDGFMENIHLYGDITNQNSNVNDIFTEVETLSYTQEVYYKGDLEHLIGSEIIIPISKLPTNLYNEILNAIDAEISSSITKFAQENYPLIKTEFENIFGESKYSDYIQYIFYNQTNEFQELYDFNYFTQVAREKIISEYLQVNEYVLSLDKITEVEDFHKEVEIVGFFFDNISNSKKLIVSDELFQDLKRNSGGNFSFAFYILGNNRKEALSVLEDGLFYNSSIKMKVQDEVSFVMNSISDRISFLSQVFFFIGVVLILFSTLLFYNFISVSIDRKSKDIGVLKALGIKDNQIFAIFSLESFFLAIISFIFAVVMVIVGVVILNSNFVSEFNIPIVVLEFRMYHCIVLLLFSILLSQTSSLIPIVRLLRKKPVEIIKLSQFN